jgi:hypothetical protein
VDGPPPPVRLADLLTTASSLADFRGESTITLDHLRLGLGVLLGETTFERLGSGLSPLVPRRGTPQPNAEVLAFARRWHERLGDPFAPIASADLAELRAELAPPGS